MEINKDYSRFKASCEEFKTSFNDRFFSTGSIFCHPLIDGVIYTPCTPEEARSNLAEACRMSDMLLMSEDGESFVPFKIAQAREIAAANGSVFIATLMGDTAFEALEWMIDGKHDTIIISEEHMRKEGKPYAPVTPLTNVIQPFKKSVNNFLYKKGTVEEPAVLTVKDIEERISTYSDELLGDFPRLEITEGAEFEIFGQKLVTDRNESRCAALEKGLAIIDTFEKTMGENLDAFDAAGYDYDSRKSVAALLAKAAQKCNVTADKGEFEKLANAEEMKNALTKLISEKNSFGFKYTKVDDEKAATEIGRIEMHEGSADELKTEIMGLLSVRPCCGAVFNLARATSPADAEAVESISEYWGIAAMKPVEIAERLKQTYVPKEVYGEDGSLVCEGTRACFIAEQIRRAAAKYKIKNVPAADELEEYCKKCEIDLRTYNGTVFDTIEEMEKAVRNEKELEDLCGDLSALDKDELVKLRKYIHDMKLDKKTAGKYLLKIKLAMNSCEENSLKRLCTGLTLKKHDELSALRDRLVGDEYDEVVAAPYICMVNDCILRTQLAELTEMFRNIPDRAKADELEKALASDKYDAMFKKHFTCTLSSARDGFARREIEELCRELSSADRKTIDDITAKLDALKCSNSIKASARKDIAKRICEIEEQEAAKAFAGIDKADRAKLDELRKIISSGKFKAALTDKYAAQIKDREAEIENAEFIKKCDLIPQMNRDELDEITALLESEKYDEKLVNKYLPMVAEREKALIKAELAQLCKDIPSMDTASLDKLEKTLSDEKYDKDMTSGYFDTIRARRKTIINKEADELCKNVQNMDKAALAQLTEKLKDDKFDKEYTKKHFEAIEKRFNKIETDKLEQMCKGMDKLKKPELEKLASSIEELGFKKENTAPYTDRIRKLEISLMKSEMETLCKNISTTPRKELSKLKEALTSGEFDKELSAKYIEQIDKRTAELIKNELAELCKNIANAPKDKLMHMKLTIAETPEYGERGKAYAEQIESRLKQIDKAEFDKQMTSIEKMGMEELERFTEELENRKPALDTKLYEASAAKCKERMTFLEKQEIDKLCADISTADVNKLNEIRSNLSEGSYTPEIILPYIKRLDEAINDRHVKYFTKLTENINGMSRAELIVLLEKINKNEKRCPDDMVARYVGRVNAKIKESDEKALAAKCKNLGSTSERQSFELIKDINAMDIDSATKKRYITQVELHITDIKTRERDGYVEKLRAAMDSNSINGVHFYVPGVSKVFESQYVNIKSAYASTEQFELPVLIHEVTQGHVEESYLLTVDALYYKGKDGFDHISLDQIDRFEAKKGMFSSTIAVVEMDGKTSVLPNAIDKKLIENAASVLNTILSVIQKDKAAAHLREAEEIREAEAAKQREADAERAAVEAARRKAEEVEKAEKTEAKESVKTVEAKPEAKEPENTPPIKPIKPISVVVSPIPEVKQIKPLDSKPADSKPAESKPAESKPAEGKPAESKPAESKPAESKPRMKFCDQCGAKITSDTAKFCAECGNKLIK